jgi:iron complex outermembrane receptor protein
MMLKLKSMPFAIACAIASGALTCAAPAFAQAQQGSTEPSAQRVVVTGSLISRTNTETPTPVQVLTAPVPWAPALLAPSPTAPRASRCAV